MNRRHLLALGLSGLALPWILRPAAAEESWPSRPMRLIVPFPPGSASDTLARELSAKVTEAIGQTMVVENRPGAGGTIGTDVVAKAAPDGGTFLMATAAHTITAATYPKLPFSPKADFEPVTRLLSTPLVLVVHPELPVQNVQELCALAKKEPGRISFASSGLGTSHQMASELLKAQSGIDIMHVPYKGSAPAQIDLVAGRAQMMFDNIVAVVGHVRARRLKAIAVSTPQRSAILPEVPTMAESGFPDFDVSAWFGIMAPRGTPATILSRMASAAGNAIKASDVSSRLAAEGGMVIADTPDSFTLFLDADYAKWDAVAKAGNIKLGD